MKSELIDMTGQRCGKWTVLRRALPRLRPTKWVCRCDCGTIAGVVGSTLRNKTSTQCLGCRRRIYNTSIEQRWARARTRAKLKNFEFDITAADLENRFKKQQGRCALSYLFIQIEDKTASLDRIDSTKGYLLDNIQWVHKDINNMKMDLSEERFVELCNLVTNYQLTRGE